MGILVGLFFLMVGLIKFAALVFIITFIWDMIFNEGEMYSDLWDYDNEDED